MPLFTFSELLFLNKVVLNGVTCDTQVKKNPSKILIQSISPLASSLSIMLRLPSINEIVNPIQNLLRLTLMHNVVLLFLQAEKN